MCVDVARLPQVTVEGRPGDLARQPGPRPRERLENGGEVGCERRAPSLRAPEVLGECRRETRPTLVG